jgi:hypothetical protein
LTGDEFFCSVMMSKTTNESAIRNALRDLRRK